MALQSVARPLLTAAWLTGVSSGPQHRAHLPVSTHTTVGSGGHAGDPSSPVALLGPQGLSLLPEATCWAPVLASGPILHVAPSDDIQYLHLFLKWSRRKE